MASSKKDAELFSPHRSSDEKSLALQADVLVTTPDVDEPYEGQPTEEEHKTLRKTHAPMPWPVVAMCLIEFAERASYYGSSGALLPPAIDMHPIFYIHELQCPELTPRTVQQLHQPPSTQRRQRRRCGGSGEGGLKPVRRRSWSRLCHCFCSCQDVLVRVLFVTCAWGPPRRLEAWEMEGNLDRDDRRRSRTCSVGSSKPNRFPRR